MNQWAERHRAALQATLEPGETLRNAERVIARGRRLRTLRDVPRVGFILLVTDRRIVALKPTRWLARPTDHVITAWAYVDGATLAPAPLGRLRLVLPDRTVVTLGPYGPRSVSGLASPGTNAKERG